MQFDSIYVTSVFRPKCHWDVVNGLTEVKWFGNHEQRAVTLYIPSTFLTETPVSQKKKKKT